MKSKILAIIIAGVMVLTLVACGSDESSESTESASASSSESETPSETETAEPSETEDEDSLAPDGVWETDDERVTIEDDTVTIEYIDDEGEVTETYWVGSFELDEDSDTWTSTRDPEAEMTCESDTIEFTWAGEGENVYDKLSYAVTNEDGTTTTVTLERTESLGDIEKGVVPDFDSSDGDTSSTSASSSASNNKNSDTASVSDNASASASTSNNSNNDSSDKSSGSTTNNGTSSGSTASNSNTSSGSTNSSSGNSSSNSNSSSSSSSSGSSSNSSGNSSSNASSGSSGTTSTACSHNYQGTVTKNATCSAAGVKTYTCSKCGASYTEAIPATGSHNWQAVYKTVHHDATGHYETTPVYESRYVCGICGWYLTDLGGMSTSNERSYLQNVHQIEAHGQWGNYSTQMVQVGTTSTWVVDSAAYDEQIIDYYYCTVCNATQ